MQTHTIIATRLPWPSPKDRPERRHLRLEWRATTTEGAELVARTPEGVYIPWEAVEWRLSTAAKAA